MQSFPNHHHKNKNHQTGIINNKSRQQELRSFALAHLKMARILDSLEEIYLDHPTLTIMTNNNNNQDEQQQHREMILQLINEFEFPSSDLLKASSAIQGFTSELFDGNHHHNPQQFVLRNNVVSVVHNDDDDYDSDCDLDDAQESVPKTMMVAENNLNLKNKSDRFFHPSTAPPGLCEALLAPQSLDFVQFFFCSSANSIINDKNEATKNDRAQDHSVVQGKNELASIIPILSYLLENYLTSLSTFHHQQKGTKDNNNNQKINDDDDDDDDDNNPDAASSIKEQVQQENKQLMLTSHHNKNIKNSFTTFFHFSTPQQQEDSLAKLSSIVEIISEEVAKRFITKSVASSASPGMNNNHDNNQLLRRHLRKLSKTCLQVAEFLQQLVHNQPPLMNKQQKITCAICEHLIAAANAINPVLPRASSFAG